MLYNKNFNPQLYGAVIKGHGIRGGIKTPTVYIGSNNNEDLPHFQRGDLLDANATVDAILDIMGGSIPEGIEQQLEEIRSTVNSIDNRVIEINNRIDNIKGLPDSIIAEDDGLYQVKNNIIYPIAHPDLSTQPSVLPQRYGNLNMYEVLVPYTELYDGCIIPIQYVPATATITECFAFSSVVGGPCSVYTKPDGWRVIPYFHELDDIDKFRNNSGMILVRYFTKDNQAYYYDGGSDDNIQYTVQISTDQSVYQIGISDIYTGYRWEYIYEYLKDHGSIGKVVVNGGSVYQLMFNGEASDGHGRECFQFGVGRQITDLSIYENSIEFNTSDNRLYTLGGRIEFYNIP